MDSLSRWSAQIVDLRTLFSEWERRHIHTEGKPWSRRFREIHSICMFTLCIENGSDQRYLVGFQERGISTTPVQLNRLFDNDFGVIEDCDVVLVDQPKKDGESIVPHHRCQFTSNLHQPSTLEVDLAKFLDKKLNVARDDDLRLVIHFEQEGPINYLFLHALLSVRSPKCPYSQVFAFGQTGNNPRKWFCTQVYPVLAVLPELDENTAKKLVLDRKQYSGAQRENQVRPCTRR